MKKRFSKLSMIAVGAVFALAACDSGTTEPSADGPTVANAVHINDAGDGVASFERLEVCKEWVGGSTLGTDFEITTNNDTGAGGAQSSQTRVLYDASGDATACRNLVTFDGRATGNGTPSNPGNTDLVRVVETQPVGTRLVSISAVAVDPAGAQLYSVYVDGSTANDADGPMSADFSSKTWETNRGDNTIGYLVTYTNELIPVGGEGCTPGYWKNHAGPYSLSEGGKKKPSAWEGFLPTDTYDAVFGVTSSFGAAFRLIDAADKNGGGESALARHAVAALLSAAHSGVDYDLTVAGVKAVVQNAYATGDFNGAKNQLAPLNEQGCPL